MSPITVMLVDDNPTFLRIASRFLQEHEDIQVVGTINNSLEAVERAEQHQPQVILVDLAMPKLAGLEAIPLIRAALPDTSIIALTLLDTDSYRRAALAAGAHDFVPKSALSTDLIPAIRDVIQGVVFKSTETDPAITPVKTSSNILVLEDDEYLRTLYAKALRRAGYDLYQAATLQEARILLDRHRFDLFLCDIQVDGDYGTDLLREYREVLERNGTQTIIVSGEAQYRNMSDELGAEFFMVKPVAIGELVTISSRLLAMRVSPAFG